MGIFESACPWYVAGPLLGLLVAGLLWAINKPLGALGGYCDAVQWLERPRSWPSWRVLFLVGTMVGGALSALASGAYAPTLSYGSFNATFGPTLGAGGVALLLAGAMIGFGARHAGGCTSASCSAGRISATTT